MAPYHLPGGALAHDPTHLGKTLIGLRRGARRHGQGASRRDQ
jgi:hypothetical protein